MRKRRLALPLLLLLAGCGYNTIQTLDEQSSAAKSQIEVQLQRRADLIPNLVNTVKGYAQHEEEVFTQVAQARAGLLNAVRGGDPQQMADANAGLTAGLGRLLAISEAYPQLKADQSFLRLQDELTGTENRIAVARNDYNQAAQQYNTYIRRFPQTLTAKVIGAKPKNYFEVTNPANREAPTVDFSKPAASTSSSNPTSNPSSGPQTP
ncbi:MAG TPA: LemA family protein [Gemmatimonadaceae bacterium]|jgi:LemA protein|nr:LemA family protein [Gemmatimonadaceae bacterium]